MAHIINLRQARKARARAEAARQADANRAKFGRTKAQKSVDSAIRQRDARHLDRHRLTSDEAPD